MVRITGDGVVNFLDLIDLLLAFGAHRHAHSAVATGSFHPAECPLRALQTVVY